MTIETELKAALAKNLIELGSRQTAKAIKANKAKVAVLSSNCPGQLKNEITNYSKVSGIGVENFSGTGKQLGIFCGKPFSVAALAIKKEEKKK